MTGRLDIYTGWLGLAIKAAQADHAASLMGEKPPRGSKEAARLALEESQRQVERNLNLLEPDDPWYLLNARLKRALRRVARRRRRR